MMTMPKRLSLLRPALAGLVLILLTGCSHSRSPLPTATGSPEALAVVSHLRTENTQPLALSGIFTWTTTQPQSAYAAERIGMHMVPFQYRDAAVAVAATQPSQQSLDTIMLRVYAQDVFRDGPPQGTHTEARRYEQRQQGQRLYVSRTFTTDAKDELPWVAGNGDSRIIATWDGQAGCYYYPVLSTAHRSTDYSSLTSRVWYGAPGASPDAVRLFSYRAPFPAIIGQVTLRHEQINGEDLLVLHEDLADLYREYYLSPKDDYAPRRILQRMKHKLVLSEQTLTGTIEYETGHWPFRHRETRQVTIPAEPMQYLDWTHAPQDSDTTITAWTRRPDGQWFITESTTTYPFSHRTETFKAENLSFAPLPASAFEIHLPPDVHVNR